MQLMRRQSTWDPFSELDDLSNRFSPLLNLAPLSVFRTGNGEKETLAMTDWAPSCDISETEEEYRVNAELPKIGKEGVHVTLDNGILTIQGERREEKEEKGVKFHRKELAYGSFVRRFTMPDDADASKVEATFKEGMLNIVIPKSKVKPPTVKEIAIH